MSTQITPELIKKYADIMRDRQQLEALEKIFQSNAMSRDAKMKKAWAELRQRCDHPSPERIVDPAGGRADYLCPFCGAYV